MMYVKSSILCFVFLSLCSQGIAQRSDYNPEREFSVTDLQDDFKILVKGLQEIHIGLYRYSDKTEIDSLLVANYEGIDHPMTELEFFRIVNRCVVAVRDEHTFALPSNAYWRSQIGQTVYDVSMPEGKLPLFPFFVKVIDGRLFIDNNLSSDQTLVRGTEITEINDVPVDQVLNVLLPTVHTNGFVETFRYRNLEQFSLHQTYNRFIVHYAMFIGTPETFHLNIKRINHRESEDVVVSALTSKEIFNHYWRRYSSVNDPKKKRDDPLEFALMNGQTAYLRISDMHNRVWSRYNYSYSTEFRTMFEVINREGFTNLVIDLRGNEGGNLGIGIELLKYVLTQPFKPYSYHAVNEYRFPHLARYFSDTSALKDYPDKLFILQRDGTYRSDPSFESESWSRPIAPAKDPYRHKLYVLIDGATGSAASILATLIRVNRKDAIFVGEEAGGDMEGPTSGEGTGIVLPNTQIRVDIPFVRRVVNLNSSKINPGRGVMPNYQVTPSVDDLVHGEDTAMKFTISLIEQGK